MRKRSFSCLLVSVLLLSLLFALLPQRASADDLQDQIDELRRERLAIAEEQEQKQAVVDELEAQKASVVRRKEAMDERNAATQNEIEILKKEILAYSELIGKQTAALEEARRLEEEQLERYRVRVRAIEEYGELGYLDLILDVSSLDELLTALDDAGDIMKNDKMLYDEYLAARQKSEELKAQLENSKAELVSRQGILEEKQTLLAAQIQEASELILALENDIGQRNDELHSLLLEEIACAEKIDALVAEKERIRLEELARQQAEEERRRQEEEARARQQEQERQQQEEAGQLVIDQPDTPEQPVESGGSAVQIITGTGTWMWPCPSCTYVTSRAGDRYHPIFGEWRYHSGIDIGASYGAAVVAADNGTVIMTEPNGGYGNCIMIDHGNGYYSLYGHLSGYAVSYGQNVFQGQTIGYVGESGWSTGPHLHFEIRDGGAAVDPESLCGFSGLTYAPDAGD